MNSPQAKKLALLYARAALGIGFLSGVADRFGLWRGRNVGYGNFDGFVRFTAKVNSFMPAASIPFLAWAATGTRAKPHTTYRVAAWKNVAALRKGRVHVISDELLVERPVILSSKDLVNLPAQERQYILLNATPSS